MVVFNGRGADLEPRAQACGKHDWILRRVDFMAIAACADWPASVSLWEFTSSADGKRVAFLKRSPQKDVYLADLTSAGDAANPRRFTLDDSDDFATNWMPDSKAILFSSDRNGNFDIFRQSLDQRAAEAVVAGPDDESGPTAVSPDGTWFYYYVHPKGWRSTMARGVTIMRTPVSGGAHQKIADDPSATRSCVLDCRRPLACWSSTKADSSRSTLLTPFRGKDTRSRRPS